MPTLLIGRKQVSLRIVYVGPGVGGKTTNLQQLNQLVPEAQLKEIATKQERTIGGDFMPLGVEPFGDWELRLQLGSVPGQMQYGLTREKLLRGADVVVFVADSQRLRRNANLYALDDVRGILSGQGRDPECVPVVFQYNKRDLTDTLSLEEMDAMLNPRGAPAVAAVALDGIGVVATLAEAMRLARGVAEDYLKKHKVLDAL
jgi:signal recognition particle receptor subunit beta